MLNVVLNCYPECRYAECRYAECRYAECRDDSQAASTRYGVNHFGRTGQRVVYGRKMFRAGV